MTIRICFLYCIYRKIICLVGEKTVKDVVVEYKSKTYITDYKAILYI